MSQFIILLALAAGNAWLWTELLLYSQNTLLLNGRWISTKRALEMSVLGADDYLLTRGALQGDQLHLEAWHGCNELIWRRPLKPARIALSFRLAPRADLSVLFEKTARGFSGLRFSADPRTPSLFFRAGPEGGFLSAQPLPLPASPDLWHRIELLFDKDRLRVRADGQDAASLPAAAAGEQSFGLRGGFGRALVDDVSVTNAAGLTETEDFANRRGAQRALAVHAAILLLACGLAAALAAWRRRAWDWTAPRLTTALLVLLTAGAALHLFDRLYWSGLPLAPLSRPLAGPKARSAAEWVEALRHQLCSGWYALAAGLRPDPRQALARDYPGRRVYAGPVFCGREPARPPKLLDETGLRDLLARKKSAYRIVFVGSSQTIGAGGRDLSDTFFVRTHRALCAAFGPRFPIESLNLAVSGTSAARSFSERWGVCRNFKPDLLIVNFAANGRPDELRAGLRGYLAAARESGIPVLVVKEAFTRAAGLQDSRDGGITERLASRHLMVEMAARTHRVPLLDLHSGINDPGSADSGFLWWDFIHLAPHGQALAARWLAPKIEGAIRRAARPRATSRHR